MKAFIFDMDGTIFDTEKVYYKTWIDVAKKRNFYFDLETKYQLNGLSYDESINKMMDLFSMDKNTAIEVRKELNELRDDYFNKSSESLKKKGLVELLDFLKNDNKKLALATSSPRNRIDFLLEKENLLGVFDVIMAGDEIEKGKPNPEIFSKAMQALKVSPEETYVIEDSIAGLEAANASGAKSVLIPDLDNREEIRKLADYVFENFLEFKNFLDNKNRGKNFSINCPNCKNKIEKTLETAFIGDDKDFSDIGKITCPKCNHEFLFNYPFTYTNDDKKYMLVNDPRFVEKRQRLAFKASLGFLDKESRKDLNDFTIRITENLNDLKEKIRIFANDKDDRIIELMKIVLVENLKNQLPNGLVEITYNEDNSFLLRFGDKTLKMDFVEELYKSLEEKYETYLKRDKEIFIDRNWALGFIEF